MSEDIEITNHQIIISGKDIVKERLGSLEDGNSDKKTKGLQEILKEIRVRFGTLLKTDNISFLFGAGTSMAKGIGGVSLKGIPLELEKGLLKKGVSGNAKKRVAGWLKLFYKTANDELDPLERYKQFEQNEGSFELIKYNLEKYLSQLYIWQAAIVQEKLILDTKNGSKILIDKKDLEKLIKEIICSFTSLLDLPKENNNDSLKTHRRFIKKVLTRPLNLRRANIFTLNNDTVIEKAADAEGAVLVDGFVGTLKRVFRPESYDLDFYFPAQTTEGRVHRFDRALHLYKLHGSVNWHRCEQDWENPYGIFATLFNQNCPQDDVLIYPTPLKYGQILGLPYSEMFRRFGCAVAQPQSVLFSIGYSFSDDHVNAILRQALTIPSFTLVIIDPKPESDFVKKLEESGDERVMIIRGEELGKFEGFVEELLPDLREEDIDFKVMQTFKALSPKKDTGDANEK